MQSGRAIDPRWRHPVRCPAPGRPPVRPRATAPPPVPAARPAPSSAASRASARLLPSHGRSPPAPAAHRVRPASPGRAGGSPRRFAPARSLPASSRSPARADKAPPATPAKSSKKRGLSLIWPLLHMFRTDRHVAIWYRGRRCGRPPFICRRLQPIRPGMILVTGGAGFIGSNLHKAALTARGVETVVVDRLGRTGKWRNLASHPPARLVHPDRLDDFLATTPPLEMVFHLGAISDTSGVGRRPRLGRPMSSCPLRLWQWCAAHAACAWSTPPRPPPTATARRASRTTPPPCRRLKPLNLYGWTKHCLRPAGRRHAGAGRAAAAAMGRAEIVQRLRPERVPQGRHGLGGPKVKHDDIRAGHAAAACSAPTGAGSPTARSSATSSGSATWSM